MAADVIFMKVYFVYIPASAKNGTLYIGVTNNLARRLWEHKNKIGEAFTCKYEANKLVYYEDYSEIEYAIKREKCLKESSRQWKIDLIEKNNSQWLDLYENGHY